MGESPEISIAEPAVLGVSVVADEIATVVRDATGEIVASNHVELADGSPASALEALRELVDTAPFTIDHIVATCARVDVRAHLEFSAHAPGGPAWGSAVSFIDLPHVLAHVARGEGTGVIGALALDRDGSLAVGSSVALVDAQYATVRGAVDVAVGDSIPLTQPAGARALAGYLRSLSRGPGPTRIVAVGSGAQLPEVITAISSATGASVFVGGAPVFALAQGATEAITAETQVIPVMPAPIPMPFGGHSGEATTAIRPSGARWWIIGGAAGLAALLCMVALVAVFTTNNNDAPAAVTSTVTAPGTTTEVVVTRTGRPDTETVTNEQTVTRTLTPPAVTSTVAQTTTETATVTVQQTVTSVVTSTVLEAPSAAAPGQ